jgi:hypothetical protein
VSRLSRLCLGSALALALAGSACAAPAPRPLASHGFDDRSGLVFLSARIGEGEALPFLLDTGASPCVIDSAVAARSGIVAGPEVRRQGGGGTFVSKASAAPVELRIGGAPLACSETLITDLSGMDEAVGGPIAGIVGGDFFRGRIVAIDYDSDKVSLFDRTGFDHAGERIPIRIDRNRPYLTARLSVADGPQDVTRELLVDTGSHDQVDDAILARSGSAGTEVAASGLGAGHRARTGRFNLVRIGSRSFADVPGVVPAVPLVGAGLLARFNLIFDYDGGWVILDDR